MALDRPSEFLRLPLPFFFVAFREKFTRISLCLYSASSPHSLIPCLLTKFCEHFLKRVTKGTFLWNYFKIWPVVSEKISKEFVHVCIVNVAPIHRSHIHERIKISLTTSEKALSRNISVNWGLEDTYSVVLTDRTCCWTNWISLEHWQLYNL